MSNPLWFMAEVTDSIHTLVAWMENLIHTIGTSHPMVDGCANLDPPAQPFLGVLDKKKHTNKQAHS